MRFAKRSADPYWWNVSTKAQRRNPARFAQQNYQMKVRNRRAKMGETLPSYAWAPFDIDDADYYIAATPADAWQETGVSGEPAQTAVSAAGDRFGYVPCPVSGRKTGALTAARRPTYIAGNLIDFAGGTSNESLVVTDSLQSFNYLHDGSEWTICVRLSVNTDSTQYVILDNINQSAANRGFLLVRLSDNTMRAVIGNGGLRVFRVTSSNTITAASGVVSCIVRCNGTDDIELILDGTTTTSAQENAFSAGNASFDMRIGISAGSLNEADMSVQDILIVKHAMTNAEITDWQGYAVSDAPSTWKRQLYTPSTSTLPCFNGVARWYDFADSSKLYQDLARTTPVTSASDPVGKVAEAYYSGSTDWGLDLTALSAATPDERPTWNDGTTDYGVLFDGTDDRLNLDNSESHIGGAHTWIAIVRGTKSGDGNHWLSGGDRFLTTGPSYGSNPPEGPYVSTHPQTGSGGSADLPGDTTADYNIIAWRIDGTSSWASVRGSNGLVHHSAETTISDGFAWQDVAEETIVGWQAQGYVVEILEYHHALTDEELEIEFSRMATEYPDLNL